MRYLVVLVIVSGMLAMAPRRIAAQAQVQMLCERVLPSPRGLEPFQLQVVAAPNGEYIALGQAGHDYGPPNPSGSRTIDAATHLYLARLTSGCDTAWQRFVPHLADVWNTSGLAVDRHGIWALMSDTVYNRITQRLRTRTRLWRFNPAGILRRSVVIPPRSYPEYACALLPAPGGGCYANVAGTGPVSSPLSGFTGQSLLRFDSTCTAQWRHDYPLVLDNDLNVLTPSLRGTLLLAGTAIRTPAFDHYPKIIEVETSRGDSVGGTFISPPPGPVFEDMISWTRYPNDLVPLTRGRGYAMTTIIVPFNGTTPITTGAVVRLDANYRVLWRYQYPSSISSNDFVSFTQVRELADGSLLALASPFRAARRCWLYRLDGTTGALLAAYAVPQGVGGQRPIKVNYLLPVAADSTLLLMGQAELGIADGGLYVAHVRIPNLPRIVTGTAAPAAGAGLVFQAYPNPADDELRVTLLAGLAPARLEVRDVLGRVVCALDVPAAPGRREATLPVRDLSAGLYNVALLVTGQPAITQRVAVQH